MVKKIWQDFGYLVKREIQSKYYYRKEVLIKDLVQISNEKLHLLEEKEVKVRESNSHLTRYYYVIYNKNENEFIVQEEELSEVRWIDIDEILKMIKNNNDRITFKEDEVYLFEKIKQLYKE